MELYSLDKHDFNSVTWFACYYLTYLYSTCRFSTSSDLCHNVSWTWYPPQIHKKTCKKEGAGITSSRDINKYSIYLSPFLTLCQSSQNNKNTHRWHYDQGTSSKDNTKSGVDIGETSKHLVKSCCKAARDVSEKDPASKLSQISTTSPWMNWGCLLFMGKGLLLLRMHVKKQCLIWRVLKWQKRKAGTNIANLQYAKKAWGGIH